MKKPVIVRSSSPYEYGDFEGIFDSIRDVYDESDLIRAITSVEASAKSERARLYAQQNGFNIDDKIHAIVQEQSPSIYAGAMMRHPNNPNLIFITWFSGRGKYQQEYSGFLYDETSTSNPVPNRGFFWAGIEEQDALFLVNQYKKLEALTDIAEGFSLFVEFGYPPFALYQARPFKKIETADFELPNSSSEDVFQSDFVFGITKPDGIVLPAVRSFGVTEAEMVYRGLTGYAPIRGLEFDGVDEDLKTIMMLSDSILPNSDISTRLSKIVGHWLGSLDFRIADDYCLMMSSAGREEYDVDLTASYMKTLVLGDTGNFMVHGLMRLIKKAEVTVGSKTLWRQPIFLGVASLEDKVRIISNGREGIVFKE